MVSAVLIALMAIGASPAEDAKRAYEKALKYSNAAEYEAALPYFERAYELSNHRPSTIVALAQCERELKLYEKAIAHFQEYLALKPAPKDSDKIAETVALLEELRTEELARKAKEEEEAARAAAKQRSIDPQAEDRSIDGQAKDRSIDGQAKDRSIDDRAKLGQEDRSLDARPNGGDAPGAQPQVTAVSPPPAEEASLFESPVFWVVTGVVVAAVATGVALGVALRPEGELYGGTSDIILRK
jgi:tetratricopeptide (TPR) repeat protein